MIGVIKQFSYQSKSGDDVVVVSNSIDEIFIKDGNSNNVEVSTKVAERELSITDRVEQKSFDDKSLKAAYIRGIKSSDDAYAVNPYQADTSSGEFIAWLEGRTYSLVL